jgi:PBP1b-binding outer membrane lipoprotein LpoB
MGKGIMRKTLSILLVLIFTLAMLAGCSSKETAKQEPAKETTTQTTTTTTTTTENTGIAKIGLGHITSIGS